MQGIRMAPVVGASGTQMDALELGGGGVGSKYVCKMEGMQKS